MRKPSDPAFPPRSPIGAPHPRALRILPRLWAFLLLWAGLAQAGPYDTWAKYKTLTINTTNAGGGANVSGTVTDFPVLIRITTATAEDILDEALSSGADVRFASSDGSTALSYQIERWTSTAAEVWVLVPSIAGNSTTDIRVYWGKSGQTTASSGSSVFSTSNGFVGVWHLGETGNSSVDGYKDATGTAAHAQGTNFGSGNEATAVAGVGQTFANASSRKITVKSAVEASFDITSAITISTWINVQSWSPAWQAILTKGDGAWRLSRNNGAGNLTFVCTGLTTNTSIVGSTTLTTGGSTWYHVTGQYDGSNLRLYLNGATDAAAVTATGSIATQNYNVVLGENEQATGRYFDGKMDEVRVENVARSADWIKLSYQTQKTGASCIVYGSTRSTTFYWNRNDILTSSTDFSKAYNWTMNADGTGRRAPSSADDDFTSTSLGGSWTCQDADNNAGTSDCNQTDKLGRLWMEGFGADIWTTTNEFIALRRSDITGDFDVSVRVDSIYNTNTAAKVGLYMADDFTNLGSGGYAGIALRGDLKLEMSASTGTVGQLASIAISGSAVTAPVWLRLVKNGTSVTGYYRTSLAAAWTNLGGAQTPLSTASNSQIGLVICSHNASLATVGVFDEFQGGSTLSASALDLSFAGTGSSADANATLSANVTAGSLNFTGYSGTLNFGSSTLSIGTGNATFASSMAITPGTGTLAFTGATGTQVLVPPSADTLPNIANTGAGTLQLSTNALYCVSYAQSAGVLDFNSLNLTTTGAFTVTSGTSLSFANLNGRTVTVGGNASLAGQNGNYLDLNAGSWSINVAGTLAASYATLAGSDASSGSQGTATNCRNAGGNTNWLFDIPTTLARLTRSLRINFNTTAAGVTGNVANIPILVRLSSSNFTFSAASADGKDVLFVDKDGSTLYHEVVEWDKANQSGKLWVKVPQVDGSSTTDYITLYYGCDSCTSNTYARSDSVFTVFKSVFHLNAPEQKAYDATTLANHGTFVSNLANLSNGGIVSKNAAVFDGTTDSYIDIPNESNYDLTTNISLWAWVKVGSFTSASQAVVTKADNTFRLSRYNSTNGMYFGCNKTSTFGSGGSVNVNDGNWHLAVGTYDGSNVKLYVDGAQDGSSTALTGSVDVNNTNVHIGDNAGVSGRVFNGSISEVRIGNTATALSSDFIKLSYENQKATSSLFTYYTTASFQNSKVFKLNTTASGANVAGDVTNFPLLIRLSGVTALGANNTGTTVPTDIRFVDYDGTWLDYQIERWDRTGGIDSAEIWVKVPTVEGNYAGHTITMYYKQAASVSGTMADGQCASCVFSTANNFVADWHLNTSGTGARPDASGNSYSLTTNNYSGSEFKGGIIAGADSLNGTTQYLSIGTNLNNWSTGFTYTGWAYWVNATASYARLFDFGNGAPVDNFWSGRNGTSTGWTTEIYNNTTSGIQQTAAAQIATGTWGHFAITISGTTIKAYKNGSLVLTATSGQSLRNSTRNLNYLGKSNWAVDGYFQGKMDEVALANTPRDSNWIKLCYQNQRRDATPLFNPVPTDFVSTQKYVFNTTKTGANVSGNVTNFPLLVRITGTSILDAVEGTGTNAPPDIRFLDADGTTWLNYVVERWTRTTDSAEVWVQVPQVDGNSDHDYITMYYNSVTTGAIADGQCGSCVFGTANGFTGTWHMNDSATSATVSEVVASANGTWKLLTTNENTVNHTSTGIIGRSLDFGGSGGGMPSAGHADNFTHTLDLPKTTGTISHWVKPDQVRTMATLYESDGTTVTTYNGWGSGNVNEYEVTMGISNTNSYGICYQDGTDGTTLVVGAGTPVAGTWAHVASTWDRSGKIRVYVNGVQTDSADMSSVSLNSTAATIRQVGRVGDSTAARNWDGSIDELEVSNVARSSDWMKLAYETQRRTGNAFWNSRLGPNNKATLTATTVSQGNIALSWTSTVSDSSNADSVGIWVGYSATPDSANDDSAATFVVKLAKADTAYSYPATYPGTYYFALAVRNTSGKWSPVTSASSASATVTGVYMADTIYVDSATGSNSNSCSAAQNPATPRLTITSALTCGASATDTLVVRVMPGTYASDNSFSVTSSKPSMVISFDNASRAILAGNGSVAENSLTWNYGVALNSNMILKNMDVRANSTSNAHIGIYVRYNADYVDILGNRVYGTASYAFDTSVTVAANNNEGVLIANNVLYRPNKFGVQLGTDDNANVMHNVFYGTGGGSTKGVNMTATSWDAGWYNITNNIFYNWAAGIQTVDADSEVGNVSNNLFFLVTSGSEVVKETDANRIIKDPLFANTTIGNPNAFKLLPGSPAIDAGTSTRLTTSYACNRFASTDLFGSGRSLGSAPDIGIYEGSGYSPSASAEFDTLRVSSTATTVTVQSSKWKLTWDKARGAGITGFYDKTTDSTANLVYTNSLLFDAKVGAYTASAQTGAGPTLTLQEGTRARARIRQTLPVSASIDLNIYYSVYPSGHVYIESELSNLATSTTAVTTVDYTLRLGSTTSAFTSADSTRGFGYLTTLTRDAMLAVTRPLDGGSSGAERWAVSTAASGTPGTVVFNTTDMADLFRNTSRRHDFLLYIGDNSLDYGKTAALNADAYGPSALTMLSGSLDGERSWQDMLMGHWTLDDGAGATARDKSVFVQTNATLGGANYKWVSGKANGGLYLTTTDSAYVTNVSGLNPGNGFTVMFWVKPDFTGMGDTAMIVSKGLGNASGWYFRKVANASGTNKIVFNMGGTTVTSPSLTDLDWSHIAVVAQTSGNKALEMYVNGVQVAVSTAAGVPVSNSLNLVMGYASPGSAAAAKFKGTLDDVRVYGLEVSSADVQSIYNKGFSSRYGHYSLRADNNDRVVALINPDTAKTRVQPAFYVSNWYGPRAPKYVYLNGGRLTPNVDFVSDTTLTAANGSILVLQLNKVLTGADQTLFIDDDDSTGYMGSAAAMKSLTITATAGDKIAIKNFSDTVFSTAGSGQWYMELDLTGWTSPTASRVTDTGFGEINVWKAAAISPSVAISSARQLVGVGTKAGTTLTHMKLDATGSPNEMWSSGTGYASPAGITYTLVDSSSTRLSLTLAPMSLSGEGTATITKRFTFYPTGRAFVSYVVSGPTINFDTPRLDLTGRYDGNLPATSWSAATAASTARWALVGGSGNFHSVGYSFLSIKNAGGVNTSAASMIGSASTTSSTGVSQDQWAGQMSMPTALWTSANAPVTLNFMVDFSKDFTDSATADSLLKDSQNPAVITALTSGGTRVTNDALDFNGDNFAEGDGAYTYSANTGTAHFKFVNTVTSFNPAFRISSWTQGTLPEFVVLDNQALVKGYQYNAYLKTASNEVVLQFNKTLAPGTHVIFISHKSGLAVKLNRFEAKGADGVDSLTWTTESEFENLGFHLWRREVPADSAMAKEAARVRDSLLAEHGVAPASGAADGAAKVSVGDSAEGPDTLPSLNLTAAELAKLGYVRITPKLIPGAPGGSSASTREYLQVDRTAAFGKTYEYLLEAIDFNDGHVFYGPRGASPGTPYNTEILPNYPNPFNPITTMRFSLREKLKLSLVIYDARGRVVRTLIRPEKPWAAGKYSLIWDARNDLGIEVPSGQYFYRFTAGRYVKARKMILLK